MKQLIQVEFYRIFTSALDNPGQGLLRVACAHSFNGGANAAMVLLSLQGVHNH